MDLTPVEARETAELWYFDPWRLLLEEPFLEHPASAALQATNLADRLPTIGELHYARDLSQVVRVTEKLPSGDSVIKPFDPERLPQRDEDQEESPLVGTGGWKLRPFWAR